MKGKLTLECQVADFEALVRIAVTGDDRSIADERVVNTRIRHQVSLELIQVDIEGSVKAKTGRDGADDLSDQTIEMLVAGTGDVKVATANIVDSFVVNEECAVGVLDRAMGGEDCIVGFDHCGGDTRGGINGEFELGFLAVVSRETLKEKSSEARASATAERVEDQEALKGGAVVWKVSR
jgi:hypothetical protein